jgi:type II secretory pathway pseudopilin PulG
VALAGLIMGYVSFCLIPVIAILAGIALPVFAAVQERGGEIKALIQRQANRHRLQAVRGRPSGEHSPRPSKNWSRTVSARSQHLHLPLYPCTEPMGYNYYPGKDTDPATNVLLASKGMSKRKRRIVVHVDSSARIEPATPALPAH